MKTQISRNSHRPEQRYAGVYQQQGRMVTDADWNELMDIVRGQLEDALADLVQRGTPLEGGVLINDDLTIRPGVVYTSGGRAILPGVADVAYGAQPDLPRVPSLPDGEHVLYADVWQRSVTALEAPELVDPALHGADTTTRTQTLVQIKACPATIDPENPAENPSRGDARLDLDLRESTSRRDPCDPCAQVTSDADTGVGNYLFRLEVHQVHWSGGAVPVVDAVTLKWSSENGSEQCRAGDEPVGFVGAEWIYEFYDHDSERHLGRHWLSSAAYPRIGVLVADGYPNPVDHPADRPFVRRWDGYCVLRRSGSSWHLMEGQERGNALSVDPVGFDGGVNDTVKLSDQLEVHLTRLTLRLELQNRVFMAGDYWLAPVRELTHQAEGADGAVLVGGEPSGVEHHYLKLARVQMASGFPTAVARFDSDADRRRMEFPALTALRARDVGFEERCNELYHGAENVQQALDALCQINAADINYKVPTCPRDPREPPTVQSLLREALRGRWPDGDRDGKESVKDVLDALLCELDAAKLPFSNPCPTRFGTADNVQDALAALCEIPASEISYQPDPSCELSDQPDVTNVQAALDALCARPTGGGGGCRVSVGEQGGEFATVNEALKKLLDEGHRDLCLCLLPGEHAVQEPIEISVENLHLSITGCESSSSRLQFGSHSLSLEAGSVSFSRLGMDLSAVRTQAVIKAEQISFDAVTAFGFVAKTPLLVLDASDHLRLSDSRIEVHTAKAFELPKQILAPSGDWVRLFDTPDGAAFRRQILRPLGEMIALPANQRRAIVDEISRNVEAMANALSPPERASYAGFTQALAARRRPSLETLVKVTVLIRLAASGARVAPALVISNPTGAASLTANEILGITGIYGTPGNSAPSHNDISKLKELIESGQVTFATSDQDLRLHNNRFGRLSIAGESMEQLAAVIAAGGGEVTGLFAAAYIAENRFLLPGNSVMAGGHSWNGNRFEYEMGWPDLGLNAGLVVGENATYVATCARHNDVVLTDATRRSSEAANLGISISS